MKSNVKLIVRVTLLFWCLQKAMSYKLWLADRNFPLVPVISFNPDIHLALFITFFLLAVVVFIKPLRSSFIVLLLLTEIMSMLGDQMRWQPWQYQYLFILFAVLLNLKNEKRVINCIILILASTYFFSGLEKLNRGFLTTIWTKLILIRLLQLSPSVYSNYWLHYAGLFIPVFEMICGVIILIKKQRAVYALLPLALHLFVVYFLGPAGIKYNMIVVPWNIAMGIFIYLIFIKNKFTFAVSDLFANANFIIAFTWLFLPVLGLFGYWDKMFSSSIYSGSGTYLFIYVNKKVANHPELLPYLLPSKNGYENRYQFISTHNWCLGELDVPIPPEQRVYTHIEQSFKETYPDLEPVIVCR